MFAKKSIKLDSIYKNIMPDILHLAIPGFALLLLAEVIFDTISKRELFETKDTFSSLAMGIGNVVVGLATKGVIFALYLWIYQFRIITLYSCYWRMISATTGFIVLATLAGTSGHRM